MQTFFLDEVVARDYRPDAILTLVDAVHATRQPDERSEARRQVGFADHLFISKTDLVDAESVRMLRRRLREMNPRASQRTVHFGCVELTAVFDLGGFNLSPELTLEPLPGDQGPSCGSGEHDHHHHEDDVKSLVFRSAAASPRALRPVPECDGPELWRRPAAVQGHLNLADHHHKVIFQGVHQLMSTSIGDPWASGEERQLARIHRRATATEWLLRSLELRHPDLIARGALRLEKRRSPRRSLRR